MGCWRRAAPRAKSPLGAEGSAWPFAARPKLLLLSILPPLPRAFMMREGEERCILCIACAWEPLGSHYATSFEEGEDASRTHKCYNWAISGVIGTLITLFVNLRKLVDEKKRLENEIRYWQAQVDKLRAETEEISRRLDEQRRQRLRELYEQLRNFETQQPEDPIGMLAAIRQLRQSLDRRARGDSPLDKETK